MPSAPTPPPHVPVNYLLAGGGSFFSLECQKAIAELGWHPDEFGSYDGTLSYIQKCRQAVKDGTATGRQAELGRAWNTAPGQNDPQAFTSGHLVMNATCQGQREDVCSNRVNGYRHNLAPSMPHQGLPRDDGSQHQRHTQREYRDAQAGGAQKDGRYANGETFQQSYNQMRADARSRARELVRERREQIQAQSNQNQTAGSSNQANVAQNADMTKQSGWDPNKADPSAPDANQVKGSDAEECIENFVDMAFEGMLADAKDPDVIKANQAAAGDATAVTPEAIDAARADRDRARIELATATRLYGNSRSQRALVQNARQRYNQAQARYSNMTGGGAQAACMAEQGQALANNPNNVTRGGGPRQPSGSAPGSSAGDSDSGSVDLD